uniref:Uncharacterized protein n=1 Tax=Avena sativa TaxID=4498 RepID=A0ACD5ZSZ8_AVESA
MSSHLISFIVCRLCVPQTVGNGFNYPSDPVLRHAAILDHFSASSSSTPPLMISPQQTSYDAVINFPIVRTRTLDQTSAFNSGRQASDFAPWGADSTLELAFAKLSLGELGSEQMAPQELMQNNHGTPAMGVPSLRQHGSAQLTSQRLMQNGEVLRTFDIKGKRPASEIVEQKVRVHVASLIAEDGTTGAAGLLIKKGTWQFMCAACFPMQAMEQVIFAAACCEGIKIARAYQPTTIVLESHLFHLLNLLAGAHAPCPQMEELMKLLDPSRCTVEAITEEGNGAARQLAIHSLMTGVSEIFFSAPPDWLALT